MENKCENNREYIRKERGKGNKRGRNGQIPSAVVFLVKSFNICIIYVEEEDKKW